MRRRTVLDFAHRLQDDHDGEQGRQQVSNGQADAGEVEHSDGDDVDDEEDEPDVDGGEEVLAAGRGDARGYR